ncbi:hypothetical protein JAAARDRAFT_207755 [Jaapia argillacea MUCL 33604]|uniref:Uncharacterized protein n=1 Tax=Jaapia argillacea MUCL 33604 TaxID=933084 RepID=A0A067Q225_9AGAM|nr:hypothetical protein JAAARDRAFT_207755 [Jaapia argillacea MUCL 33604]
MILMIVQMDSYSINDNFLEQLEMKLSDAYESNRSKGFDRPVHALLTDLRMTKQYTFDGKGYSVQHHENHTPSPSRSEYFVEMARFTESIFEILLDGYIDFLQAQVNGITYALAASPALPFLLTPLMLLAVPPRQVYSDQWRLRSLTLATEQVKWQAALEKADAARTILQTIPRSEVGEVEESAQTAMSLLKESTRVMYGHNRLHGTRESTAETLEEDAQQALDALFPTRGGGVNPLNNPSEAIARSVAHLPAPPGMSDAEWARALSVPYTEPSSSVA